MTNSCKKREQRVNCKNLLNHKRQGIPPWRTSVCESVSPCVLTRTGLGSGPDSREPVSGRARYELCFPQFWHSPHLSSLEVSSNYREKFTIFGEGPVYDCWSIINFAHFEGKSPNFREGGVLWKLSRHSVDPSNPHPRAQLATSPPRRSCPEEDSSNYSAFVRKSFRGCF